jgi:8-oxo-dGTP pyrophosphatase MutT (NUDIX family)
MNERIRELSEQVGINVIPRRPYIDEEPDGYLESDNDFVLNNHEVVVKLLEGDALKKFAELIVRECAEVASKVVVEHEGVDFGLVEKCYEHFGVG